MSTATTAQHGPIDRDEVHGLLLALAGRVPDDGLAVMRTYLADGEEADLAAMLVAAVGSGRLPLTGTEDAIFAALSSRHGDPMHASAGGLERPPVPDATFSAVSPGGASELEDNQAERAAIEAASRLGGVRALWRTWRTAPGAVATDLSEPLPFGASRPDPIHPARVFLVETEPDADQVELAAEIQQSLAEAGETPPRVEVFGPDVTLAAYHDAALASAELLWTPDADAEVQLARAFDGADPERGPFFRPNHRVLATADREPLMSYLLAAEVVLETPGLLADVVEPGRGAVVPVSFRSDGIWIWPETVAYYLREHGLAPDPQLAAHIHAAVRPPSRLSRSGRHRVLAALTGPPAAPPVWHAE